MSSDAKARLLAPACRSRDANTRARSQACQPVVGLDLPGHSRLPHHGVHVGLQTCRHRMVLRCVPIASVEVQGARPIDLICQTVAVLGGQLCTEVCFCPVPKRIRCLQIAFGMEATRQAEQQPRRRRADHGSQASRADRGRKPGLRSAASCMAS